MPRLLPTHTPAVQMVETQVDAPQPHDAPMGFRQVFGGNAASESRPLTGGKPVENGDPGAGVSAPLEAIVKELTDEVPKLAA